VDVDARLLAREEVDAIATQAQDSQTHDEEHSGTLGPAGQAARRHPVSASGEYGGARRRQRARDLRRHRDQDQGGLRRVPWTVSLATATIGDACLPLRGDDFVVYEVHPNRLRSLRVLEMAADGVGSGHGHGLVPRFSSSRHRELLTRTVRGSTMPTSR
jgi:hypothetical protein